MRLAGVLPAPQPWVPVNSVIGFTDDICAGLQTIAVVGLAGVAALGPRLRWSLPRWGLAGIALTPVVVLWVLGSSDGFASAGFPAGTMPPQDFPTGRMSTVEYCRPTACPWP